MAHW
jgi:saccharopepsin